MAEALGLKPRTEHHVTRATLEKHEMDELLRRGATKDERTDEVEARARAGTRRAGRTEARDGRSWRASGSATTTTTAGARRRWGRSDRGRISEGGCAVGPLWRRRQGAEERAKKEAKKAKKRLKKEAKRAKKDAKRRGRCRRPPPPLPPREGSMILPRNKSPNARHIFHVLSAWRSTTLSTSSIASLVAAH